MLETTPAQHVHTRVHSKVGSAKGVLDRLTFTFTFTFTFTHPGCSALTRHCQGQGPRGRRHLRFVPPFRYFASLTSETI